MISLSSLSLVMLLSLLVASTHNLATQFTFPTVLLGTLYIGNPHESQRLPRALQKLSCMLFPLHESQLATFDC